MNPRIRAVYLSTMWPPFGQGGEELTNQENFEILRDILDIRILTTTPEASPGFTHTEAPDDSCTYIHRCLSPAGAVNGKNIQEFRNLLAAHRPELLLIGHPYGFGAELVDELKRCEVPKVFFIGDISCYQTQECGIFPPHYFENEYCIFVSDFTRSSLSSGWHPFLPRTRQFLFTPERCFTLHLSIKPQADSADMSRFSICSLGRIDGIKGFDTLINSSIQYNYAQFLTIYGDGPNRQQCSRFVNCPGWLNADNKFDMLRQHSVFVFPSLYHETFGRTWLEAASAGLPLVVSDIDVLDEVIPAGHAIRFRRGDPNDLARAIHMLTEVNARKEYQQRALELARLYNPDRRHRQLTDIINNILATESTDQRPGPVKNWQEDP